MRGARFGLGEALGGAADGRLPDTKVPLAIGLKRNAVVPGPDRKAVVPSERESPHRARAGQVIGVDICLVAVIYPKGDVRAVWRHPRRYIGTGQEL